MRLHIKHYHRKEPSLQEDLKMLPLPPYIISFDSPSTIASDELLDLLIEEIDWDWIIFGAILNEAGS